MKSSKKLLSIALAVCIILTCVISTFSASAVNYSDNMKLRVGIIYGNSAPSSITVSCSQGFMIVDANEQTGEYTPILQIPDTTLTVKNQGGRVVVYSGNGNQVYTGDGQIYLRGNNNSLKLDSKTYIEIMKFSCFEGKLFAINILSLESYIKGVLPREVYPSWPEESLKSAAIIARTFAVHSLAKKHNLYGFDVCNTTCCQVFGGNGSNEYPTTNAAVDATRNIVVAYGEDVALTVYTSSCGDYTESAQGAWGGDESRYPYLTSVYTPFETPEDYPNGVWSVTLSPSEILNYINSSTSYSGKLRGNIISIECEYSDTGYARKMTIKDDNGNILEVNTSNNVRNVLFKYLNSARFTLTPHFFEENSTVTVLTGKGEEKREAIKYGAYVLRAGNPEPVPLYENYIPLSYTFEGIGFGHGVGLSQFGAMTLAKSGKLHDEILVTYFPGTYLTTLGALGILKNLGEFEIFEELPPENFTDSIETTDDANNTDVSETTENTESIPIEENNITDESSVSDENIENTATENPAEQQVQDTLPIQ